MIKKVLITIVIVLGFLLAVVIYLFLFGPKSEPTVVSIYTKFPDYVTSSPGIHIINSFGQDILVVPFLTPREESYTEAQLSPNKKYIFYGHGIGDGYEGVIYDISTKQSHTVSDVVAGTESAGWLPDGRLQFSEGCILAGPGNCKLYQSANSDSPWIVKFIKDIK